MVHPVRRKDCGGNVSSQTLSKECRGPAGVKGKESENVKDKRKREKGGEDRGEHRGSLFLWERNLS